MKGSSIRDAEPTRFRKTPEVGQYSSAQVGQYSWTQPVLLLNRKGDAMSSIMRKNSFSHRTVGGGIGQRGGFRLRRRHNKAGRQRHPILTARVAAPDRSAPV